MWARVYFCAYHVHIFWGKVYRPTILSMGESSQSFTEGIGVCLGIRAREQKRQR